MNEKNFKNAVILIAVFLIMALYTAGTALASEKFNAASDIADLLKKNGFEIKYEVSVSPKNVHALDFFSAENTAEKNIIHVAVIDAKREPPVSPEISFGSEIRKLGDTVDEDVVLAVNGGYYALMNDKVYSVGCVMKNFRKYPFFIEHSLYPYVAVFDDGTFDIIKGADFKSVSNSKNKKVKAYLQSKPMLVYDGKTPVSLTKSREAKESKNPRTAIAIQKSGRAVCVVVEGRRADAEGMTQAALSELLIKLGAMRAINLDGGGSSTIILNGVLMNRTAGGFSPFTAPGEQRPLHSSILFRVR